NVSPVVVVPGLFTAAELQFDAENVATQMTNNTGFNCNAAKVLVLSADWPQRRDFLDLLRSVLATLPPRRAYYPGAADRYARFVGAYPGAEVVGAEAEGALPWTLLMDVDARERDQPAFREESFCGVTAVTTLPGRDARGFLKRAVDFCNETLWGTLNACLIVHPRTRAALGPAFEQALEALRYGSIGVNHWPALSYGLGTTTWGAYPGHTADDIQSGVGVVHDTYLFDRPEKSIIEGPFRVSPKPPWFVTHANAAGVARALLQMEHSPSLLRLPGLVWQAVRG
ncbi:MAG: aldehyde dehydrogenase, partial [Myxococcales bacterium]|nr:aldehyde dehydrogenase [Myxococcales bacterium]